MRHFGFDLDNTLIDYSETCEIFAQNNDLPNVHTIDQLRSILKPENIESAAWTSAQSWIYGAGLKFAKISPNAIAFIENLLEKNFKVSIFSHKTEFGPSEFGSTPFVRYANDFIKQSALANYFEIDQNLYFFPTLNLKVEAISNSKLSHYIDDLVKVFQHGSYPHNLNSYIYRSSKQDMSWLVEIDDFKEISID